MYVTRRPVTHSAAADRAGNARSADRRYPGTRLHRALADAGRITSQNWDLYDTRHVVFRPAKLSPRALEAGYRRAYRSFYEWGNIARGAWAHESPKHRAKHFFYAAGWRKFEPLWDVVIRARRLGAMTPLLEAVLAKVSERERPVRDGGEATPLRSAVRSR